MMDSETRNPSKPSLLPGNIWQRKYRVVVLMTLALIQTIINSNAIAPVPLAEEIISNYKISRFQHGLLFSDYLGLLAIFFCGYFISKYGRTLVLLVDLILLLIGGFCCALSAFYLSYPLLLTGELLIWCALDFSVTIVNTYLAVWYKNLETTHL